MTAITDTPRRTLTRVGAPASLVVVVVAPKGRLSECDLAIAGAPSRGAVTFTCEVPADATRDVCENEFAFGIAIETIGDTIDRALREVPGVPVVLVGHAEAAIPARVYADLYPEELSGVVITQAGHLTAA